jgi:4-carboxymuconolactone decarboxylase
MNDKPRYRELKRSELTPEQQPVYDAIAVPRGGIVPAPYHVLLESPELAQLTQALGAFCRYRTELGAQLSELLVLVTASYWNAEFEFAVHSREAAKAGVPGAVIEALREHRTPDFADADSKLMYDFAAAFFATRDVPDDLFEKAIARFGRRGVVELTGVLGCYSSLAILLRVFRVPA